MKIPVLTAERSLGRSLGTYLGGPPSAHHDGSPPRHGGAILPMVGEQLRNKAADGSTPCDSYFEIPCPGGRNQMLGTDFRDNYVCCNPSTHACGRLNDGTPTCRVLPPAQQGNVAFQSP